MSMYSTELCKLRTLKFYHENQPFLIEFKTKKTHFNAISVIQPACFTAERFLSSRGQLRGYLEDKMERRVLCRHLMEFTF